MSGFQLVAYATKPIACKYKRKDLRTKRMEKIERLKAFLVENPADSFVQHALALEYVKLDRDDEARILFESLLARDEKYVGSYYHLGKLLERMNDKEGAIAVMRKE